KDVFPQSNRFSANGTSPGRRNLLEFTDILNHYPVACMEALNEADRAQFGILVDKSFQPAGEKWSRNYLPAHAPALFATDPARARASVNMSSMVEPVTWTPFS